MSPRLFVPAFVLALVSCTKEAPPVAPVSAPPPAPAPAPKLTYGVALPLGAEHGIARAKAAATFLGTALGSEIEPRLFTYEELGSALAKGSVDVAFVAPLAYVQAAKQAKVAPVRKAMHEGRPHYRAALFVRADSGLAKLEDVRGKELALVRTGSASGNLFPRAWLLEQKIVPEEFFSRVTSLQDHPAVCNAVFTGMAQVGASFTNAEGEPAGAVVNGCEEVLGEKVKDLRILFASEKIPNDVVAVREGFPEPLRVKLAAALDALAQSDEGRAVLRDAFSADGFQPASDEDFAVVRRALELLPAP